MNDQRKDHVDLKRPGKEPPPPKKKPLQTNNVPTYDVENTNCTNKGRDLLFANTPWIVPSGTEMMVQKIQKHGRASLH